MHGIEARIKEMRELSYRTTYIVKCKLMFPFTTSSFDEPFPNPARQKKSKRVINYLISGNEQKMPIQGDNDENYL
jgi:hypothetical protein